MAIANLDSMKGCDFEELDFGQLYKMMKKNHIDKLEKEVFIGKDEKLPVRLIIELMPDEVFNTRMQKVINTIRRRDTKRARIIVTESDATCL